MFLLSTDFGSYSNHDFDFDVKMCNYHNTGKCKFPFVLSLHLNTPTIPFV